MCRGAIYLMPHWIHLVAENTPVRRNVRNEEEKRQNRVDIENLAVIEIG